LTNLGRDAHDNAHPIVLWSTLILSLPPNPGNAGDAFFDCLADFVETAGNEDKSFIIFPYHVSEYQVVANLYQC